MTHANVLDSLVTKQAELSGLIAKLAVEGRNASDEEKGRMEALKADIDGIEKSWKDEGRARFLANFQPATERKLVLKAGDSLADHWKGSYDADLERASISKYLRGYALGDWSNAPLEMKTMASSAAGAILPTPISSRVLDLARNKAVSFMAGAVTVPMGAATLKLPRLTGDVTAGWYSEGGTISESDATLDSVTLTARKVAVLVRVNNELLEDSSPAVDAILEERGLERHRHGTRAARYPQPVWNPDRGRLRRAGL
jgi:HK97 family phage major capsid protein